MSMHNHNQISLFSFCPAFWTIWVKILGFKGLKLDILVELT